MARAVTRLVVTVRLAAHLLGRVAAGAEVPVFLARGLGSADADARLRASARVRLLDSPRAATVLVVAGHVPAELSEALGRIHDQMARPRATVWWSGDASAVTPTGCPEATIVGPGADIEAVICAVHRELLTAQRASDTPLLPDIDPAPWRGVGPYGHGGTGMTGGVPYGRPMAGRGDDRRDGLTLDVVRVSVGPFFTMLPAGLVLDVTFAGDVVHDVTVIAPPAMSAGGSGAALPDALTAPFGEPLGRSVAIREIELARARHHLRWLARYLHLSGLDSMARRVAKMAVAPAGDPRDLVALGRGLDRPWALGRSTRGVGVATGDDAAAWGGAVARAAGVGGDARSDAPSYAALGFEPITHRAGDNRDRWRQRLAETVQAIVLASRAGTVTAQPGETLEPSAPPAPADAAERLRTLLVGAEWGDAVAIVASIDPRVEAALSAVRAA